MMETSKLEAKGKKLLGIFKNRDRKPSNEGAGFVKNRNPDLDGFFRSNNDALPIHPSPSAAATSAIYSSQASAGLPSLKVNTGDTASGHRFSDAAENPPPPQSKYQGTPIPKRNPGRINLVVRFLEAGPDVIGEGGDECDTPVQEISLNRKRSVRRAEPMAPPPPGPGQLRRTPTGFGAMPTTTTTTTTTTTDEPPMPVARSNLLRPSSLSNQRRSFIEVHQAQMRQAEGLAFVRASRSLGPDEFVAEGDEHAPVSDFRSNDYSQSPRMPAPTASPPPRPPGGSFSMPTRNFSIASATGAPPPLPRAALGQDVASGMSARKNSADQSPCSTYSASLHSHSGTPVADHRALGQQQAQLDPPTPPSKRASPPVPARAPWHTAPQACPQQQPYSDVPGPVPTQQPTLPQIVSQAAPSLKRFGTWRLPETTNSSPVSLNSSGLDPVETFRTRTRHLYELFRLSAESKKPVVATNPSELCRGALWWFITGRMGIESAVRMRPSSPDAEQKLDFAKQQAFTDLAKAYWMASEMIAEVTMGGRMPTSAEVDEAYPVLMSALKKLVMSMMRNDFMPPEDPFFPANVDKTIWIDYPRVPQDILSLLSGSGSTFDVLESPMTIPVLDAFPLSDGPSYFNFGRIPATAILTEREGDPSRGYKYRCFVSTIRMLSPANPGSGPPSRDGSLNLDPVFVLSSQDRSVNLRIQRDKSVGPTWEDVSWRSDKNMLEIRLRRGFVLIVQCSPPDYNTLFGMYDFSVKIQSSLFPRSDEEMLLRLTLKAFQYFDADPQSRVFPKDPVPLCEVGLFELLHKENSPTGQRIFHRGYRVAVVTGSQTRTLSGVNHTYPPTIPTQFGFLRGENDEPALVLRYESSRSKGRMVLMFNDAQERLRFHHLLTGSALDQDELIYCETSLGSLRIGQQITDNIGLKGFNHLPYKRVRIVNEDPGDTLPSMVLADRLRVITEFEHGTLTDRINVGPGEFRVRLDPRVPTALLMFRQPQKDFTVGVADGKSSKEVAAELLAGLEEMQSRPTVRTFRFNSLQDLHAFQAALTGFKILYDDNASTFAISRRRMVVPIHKKWEAGETRIQIVQQDTQMQMLVFFEEFSHGHCMNFAVKSTDTYETFTRSGKFYGLKIVDAKFPLPRLTENVGEEAAFVCLDSPDYASEHDDIVIGFEKEAERDRLCQFLPATASKSRMF